MSTTSRLAALAAVTVVAGLLAGPGPAYAADTSTALTATEMAAALRLAVTPSEAAARGGYRAAVTVKGLTPGSLLSVVDPVGGRGYLSLRIAGMSLLEFVVDHRGTYDNLTDSRSRAALRMMRRQAMRFEFMSRPTLSLSQWAAEGGTSPATALTEDVKHAGTRTVHDDGSLDYTYTDADRTDVTVSISAAGTLTSEHAQGTGMTATLTYTYGRQRVTLPTATATISSTVLHHGLTYLDMDVNVKSAAHAAASGRHPSTASVRTAARRTATLENRGAGMSFIKVKDVRHGARLSATNPWTHRTVAYTVTISGSRAVVRRA